MRRAANVHQDTNLKSQRSKGTAHIHIGMGQTDKDPLAPADQNRRMPIAVLHAHVLCSITENARRLGIKPQRLPHIPREAIRGSGGRIPREGLNIPLLVLSFVV